MVLAAALRCPERSVVLDQQGCNIIRTCGSDDWADCADQERRSTTHNIHPTRRQPEWNESQPPSSPAIEKNFAAKKYAAVKCNQHPWMKCISTS